MKCVDSPPTDRSFDKEKKYINSRKRGGKPKKKRERGAVHGGEAARNQFGEGVVAGSVRGRKKRKESKKENRKEKK